jgi:hypothetical protein
MAVDITPREIEDFRASFGDGRAIATVNHYLKFVKAVFNGAIRQGRLTNNPVTPIKLAREHNARNRCLSPEEEACLVDAVLRCMRPLITVALHTGAVGRAAPRFSRSRIVRCRGRRRSRRCP